MAFSVPAACTLPTAERPLRLAEFDDLFATAVRRVEPLGVTHARLHLSGPAGLAARVRDLAARETGCCSFFTFTTTSTAAAAEETVVLDIEVPAAHADVLATITRRASALSASDTALARMLAGAQRLELGGGALTALATAWTSGECANARQGLMGAVAARLERVQADLAERHRQAAEAGPGTVGWAEANTVSVSLAEDAARLQAVGAALTAAPQAGPCDDVCACATALDAAGTRYHFPDPALSCDLVADGGDAHDRIGAWQQVMTRVDRRDPLPDTETGVALRFPFDVELAATLGRLAAAEYRCCSFGSYTLVVDGTGLRLEIRMPAEAAETMAAVVGRPGSVRPAG